MTKEEEIIAEYEERLKRLKMQTEFDILSLKNEVILRDEAIKKYEDVLRKIKSPPLLYACVIRKTGDDLTDTQVAVARSSEIFKVSVGNVSKESLKLGQFVWIHPQTYAIVEVSETINSGLIAKVVDIMDGQLVISVDGDNEKRIIPCDKKKLKTLKPGFQISVLPPMMSLLNILPNIEMKSLLLGEKPNIRYGQIGGLGTVIERIRDVTILPFKEKKLFKEIGLEAPKGILLHGPPGCGKTLLVKAVATENDMTFFNISIADILSKWVGESERLVKEIFRQAKEHKPSIIFFDEIEALFTVRGMMDTSGVHKNIIAQILNEMDGLTELKDVFVIGATNRIDLVDPALLRPGRFDEIIEIPRPSKEMAKEIVSVYIKDNIPIDQKLVKKHGKEKALDILKALIVEEFYGEKWLKIKTDPEAKEAVRTVKRKDIVSGAIIASVIRTAKKNYIKRIMSIKKSKREDEGITEEDIIQSIEEESKEHAIIDMYTYEKRQREILKSGSDPMVN